MRLITNRDDNVSLRRILNIPQRDITLSTIKKIENEAKKEGISLYRSIRKLCSAKSFSTAIVEKLNKFVALLDEISKTDINTVSDTIRHIDSIVRYTETLDDERIQNIFALMESHNNMPLDTFFDAFLLNTNHDDGEGNNTVSRISLLVSIAAAFAVNCTSSLEQNIAAGRAIGVSDAEIYSVLVRAGVRVKGEAASHVDRIADVIAKSISLEEQPISIPGCGCRNESVESRNMRTLHLH